MSNYLVPIGLAHASWEGTPAMFYHSTPRDKWNLDNGHCLWIKNENYAIWSYSGGDDRFNTIAMHNVKALFRMDATKRIIYIEDVHMEQNRSGKRSLKKLSLDLLIEGIRIFYGKDWFFRFWYPHVKQKLTMSDMKEIDMQRWRITERIARPRPAWYLESTSTFCSC